MAGLPVPAKTHMFTRNLPSWTKRTTLQLKLLSPPTTQSKPHHRNAYSSAARTHSHLIKRGAATDIYSWNSILTSYGRISPSLVDAGKLFDDIPLRDSVSWNVLISSHVSHGKHMTAWDLFGSMVRKGFEFDTYTLGTLLKSVACIGRIGIGCQLHGLVVKTGFDGDVYCGSALVDVYCKCGRMEDAELLFWELPIRNVVTWNAVLSGFVRMGERIRAVEVFILMENEGWVRPDEATFASMLSLMDGVGMYSGLLQLHTMIMKCGWGLDTVVCNAAITAYSQCGSITETERLFGETYEIQDLVTWNSMLAAYVSVGNVDCAIRLFMQMMEVGIKEDMYTFTSVVSACFEKEKSAQGRELHCLVVKKGFGNETPVSNSLIAMYIKSNDGCAMDDALDCFESMEFKDNVSWNSVLTGLSQSGLSEEAVKIFCRMQSSDLKIDYFAFSAALRSCSDLAVLELGMQIHGSLTKSGYGVNEFVVSSLIYMYSKSGVIIEARRTFDESNKASSVTWNSIIFAYAQHGQGHIALDIFTKMQELQVRPDHITFVGTLSACSHIGLIDEGIKILDSIETVHGISLRMEHYACGVDLFGRAGHLDSAMKLIKTMPFEPDATVWLTLMGACRLHGDVELANQAARHLLVLQPEEHSIYVLLSHMYSGLKLWEGKAVIQRVMRERGLSKVPGWSWIEVNNQVHSFNAEDRSHPKVEYIYQSLTVLMDEIRRLHNIEASEFDEHDQQAISCY